MTSIAVEDYSWIEPSYLVHEYIFVLEKEILFDLLEIEVSIEWEISPIPIENIFFSQI